METKSSRRVSYALYFLVCLPFYGAIVYFFYPRLVAR